MAGPINSVTSPATYLIRRAARMIADTDLESPDISRETWDAALPMALMELSRWKPLLKQTSVTVDEGVHNFALPSDYLQIDWDSFGDAIGARKWSEEGQSYLFSFDSTIAAATGVTGYLGGMSKPFVDSTRFQIIDDGAGGKLLSFAPKCQTTATLFYCYSAYQQVVDQFTDPAVWTVSPGAATSFTLTFLGQTTGELTTSGLAAAAAQAALQALSTVGAGNILVTEASSAFTVTLAGTLATTAQPAASALAATGTGGTVTVTQTYAGLPGNPAMDTIGFDSQDLFVLCLCQQACLVQAVNLAGDQNLSARFEKLSDKFQGRFDSRTRFAPFGMAR
jgi:hypothetical protein